MVYNSHSSFKVCCDFKNRKRKFLQWRNLEKYLSLYSFWSSFRRRWHYIYGIHASRNNYYLLHYVKWNKIETFRAVWRQRNWHWSDYWWNSPYSLQRWWIINQIKTCFIKSQCYGTFDDFLQGKKANWSRVLHFKKKIDLNRS